MSKEYNIPLFLQAQKLTKKGEIRSFEAEVEPSCEASPTSWLVAVIGEARGVLRRRLSRVAKQVWQAGRWRSAAEGEALCGVS